jgi:predicted Rdx family selenoprotein
LNQPFANEIEIIGTEDSTLTGNFEVQIEDQLIVSKKRHGTNCHGLTEVELAVVADMIQEYVEDNAD